jgi:hypothetical protein
LLSSHRGILRLPNRAQTLGCPAPIVNSLDRWAHSTFWVFLLSSLISVHLRHFPFLHPHAIFAIAGGFPCP